MEPIRFSVHEAAKDLATFLGASWKRLSVRLWDRFEPGQSLAWLVPSTKWPAYEHSKIFVQSESDGSLLIGLYVEKGYAGTAATASGKGDPKVMNKTWVWVPLVSHMLSGRLDDTAARTTRDYVVQMDVSKRGHREEYQWSLTSGQLVPVPVQTPGAQQFTQLQAARSFKDLAQRLQIAAALEWFWIDLKIGLKLPPGLPAAPEVKGGLDPWLEWVR